MRNLLSFPSLLLPVLLTPSTSISDPLIDPHYIDQSNRNLRSTFPELYLSLFFSFSISRLSLATPYHTTLYPFFSLHHCIYSISTLSSHAYTSTPELFPYHVFPSFFSFVFFHIPAPSRSGFVCNPLEMSPAADNLFFSCYRKFVLLSPCYEKCARK